MPTRDPDIQNIIDFLHGLERELIKPNVLRRHRMVWAHQAADAAFTLEQRFPVEGTLFWPVLNGPHQINVVGGIRQDSDAHIARGGGPALDLPAWTGQRLVPMFDGIVSGFIWDDVACGNGLQYKGTVLGRTWEARYCHMTEIHVSPDVQIEGGQTILGTAGSTGNTEQPHLHIVLWIDGVRVRLEDQPAFQALLQ